MQLGSLPLHLPTMASVLMLEGNLGPVHSVAFSPDDSRIVSPQAGHTIHVWNAKTGEVVSGPFNTHNRHVNSVVFSNDGTRIVTGSRDMTICVWDTETAEVVCGSFGVHTGEVTAIAFSTGGQHI